MKEVTARTFKDHPLVNVGVAVGKDLIEIIQTGTGIGIVTGNEIGGMSMIDMVIVMVEIGTLSGPDTQRGIVGGGIMKGVCGTLIDTDVRALIGGKAGAGAEVGAGAGAGVCKSVV